MQIYELLKNFNITNVKAEKSNGRARTLRTPAVIKAVKAHPMKSHAKLSALQMELSKTMTNRVLLLTKGVLVVGCWGMKDSNDSEEAGRPGWIRILR